MEQCADATTCERQVKTNVNIACGTKDPALDSIRIEVEYLQLKASTGMLRTPCNNDSNLVCMSVPKQNGERAGNGFIRWEGLDHDNQAFIEDLIKQGIDSSQISRETRAKVEKSCDILRQQNNPNIFT